MRALAAEGRRVQALASTLLDVSRLAAEGRRLEPEAVSLAGAVDDVLTGAVPPGRVVHVAVPHEVKAWADPLALDQILSNLIGNAVEHGGPEVTITGRAEGGRAAVTVADDGGGLPAGWSGSLSSPLLSGIGRGLGLRIAARLAALLGGELRYDAGEAGGARFTVSLPRA
jgi:signal transduction histidine kinase